MFLWFCNVFQHFKLVFTVALFNWARFGTLGKYCRDMRNFSAFGSWNPPQRSTCHQGLVGSRPWLPVLSHAQNYGVYTISKWVNIKITWLVVTGTWLDYFPFHRWDVILPIDCHSLQLKIGHPIAQNPHINGLYYWTVWSSLLISTCFAILGSAKRTVAGVSCDFSSQTLWAPKRWIRIDARWTY